MVCWFTEWYACLVLCGFIGTFRRASLWKSIVCQILLYFELLDVFGGTSKWGATGKSLDLRSWAIDFVWMSLVGMPPKPDLFIYLLLL